MNMNDWNDDDLLNMYLTAYLLCLYEQTKIYQSDMRIHNRFLVEKPLGIFVGSSVKAVSKENKNQVSDVTQILLFLQDFIRNHYRVFRLYPSFAQFGRWIENKEWLFCIWQLFPGA